MKEVDIKYKFAEDWIHKLKEIFGNSLRLYSIEFPVRTSDGTKFADLVFELDENEKPFDNDMMVFELKKDKIDIGAIDQVSRYTHFIKKQLHRRNYVVSIIAGPSFSDWELKNCKDNNIIALQYDLKGNMRFI